jgi:hypothetical protein
MENDRITFSRVVNSPFAAAMASSWSLDQETG